MRCGVFAAVAKFVGATRGVEAAQVLPSVVPLEGAQVFSAAVCHDSMMAGSTEQAAVGLVHGETQSRVERRRSQARWETARHGCHMVAGH